MSVKPKITHSGELLHLIEINCTDSIKVLRSNWTANGVEAKVVDVFDNQEYRLLIIPRETKGNG